MSSNRSGGRPSSANTPPTSRRSARQQRLANREANRSLARASTHGSGGGSNQLLLYTVIAVLVGALVVVGALWLTSGSKTGGKVSGSPIAPQGSQVTPSGIATNGRTLGSSDAKVTLDLYEDFQCPNCWNFTHDIETQVVTNYVASGKVKIVYHDLIVIDQGTGGTESLDAANAGMCAADQGKFWPYHDWLFANQLTEGSGAYTKDRLKAIGGAMGGLDTAKFNSCVDSGTHNSEVQAEKPPAGGQYQTPTLVVNGTIVTYDDTYATLATAIDTALGIAPSPSPSATATPTSAPTPTPAATATPSASVAPSAS